MSFSTWRWRTRRPSKSILLHKRVTWIEEFRHLSTLLAHRDVFGKVKTGTAQDEVIFLSGRDGSHPQSCCICNISWKFAEEAPKLMHVLRLLALTSSLMGIDYTAKKYDSIGIILETYVADASYQRELLSICSTWLRSYTIIQTRRRLWLCNERGE